jgi:aryl sulfotransferase
MTRPAQKGAQFVWLASYPKSGNTWMRIMLNSLRQDGKPVDINDDQNASILSRRELEQHFGVESSDLTRDEIDAVRPELHRAIARASKEELIFRKVHDKCWSNSAGERIFPPEVSLGAIYIVRDPRDVAVSAAHYYDVDLDESVSWLAEGMRTIARSVRKLNAQLRQPLGSWSEHVTSWLDYAAMPVLLVRYEDMLADSAAELTRVVDFLGLSEKFSPETMAKVAEAHTFSTLRAQEQERGFRGNLPETQQFFRQGRSGEGKERLASAQIRQIEAQHGAIMARLGYL